MSRQNRWCRAFGHRHAVVASALVSVLCLVLGAAPTLATSNHKLLKDIWTGNHGSAAAWFTGLPSGVVFFASNAQTGNELFKTDGTRAGTGLLKNIRPGTTGSIASADDAEMVRVGNRALFAADDGTHGREPWVTNGTTAGTKLLRNIAPGAADSNPSSFVVSGSRAFFLIDRAGSPELWVTDGTGSGTHAVGSTPGTTFTEITEMTAVPQGIAFSGNNGTDGLEPWISNGTAAGTFQMEDINTGPFGAGSSPFDFTPVSSWIYFVASEGPSSSQLFMFETADSTVTKLQLETGISAAPTDLTAMGRQLFFQGTDSKGAELWRAKGNLVKRIRDINTGPGDSNPNYLTVFDNQVFFVADDGTHGRELWKSDGTGLHTTMVKDAYPEPGPDTDKGSNPAYLMRVGGLLLYEARDPSHGYSLWRSDGTAGNTQMVKDIAPGPTNFGFNGQLVMGSHMFVLGDDGSHGAEWWQTDGSKNGTFVLDIRQGSASSNTTWAAPVNGRFYITANDGPHGQEPWIVTP